MTPVFMSARGFTLLEMLIATSVTLVVTAGIFTVLDPSAVAFQRQPEIADLQQRLRVGVGQLTHDLLNAGAGSYSGLNDTTNYLTARSLVNFLAPILPYVQSSDAQDDGQGTFFSNRITIIYVPSTAAQTSLKSDMASATSLIQVNQEAGCPFKSGTQLVADPLCGFHASAGNADATKAVIYDGTGAFDAFVVTAVDEVGNNLDFQHLQQGTFSRAYKVPSRISEVTSHSYFLNPNTMQLMHDDGLGNTTPVLDNVVSLAFEYYGEPHPPALVAPNTVNLSTTYGPAPPGFDATTPNGAWPVGENCVWAIQETEGTKKYVPRLTEMGDGSTLVRLTSASLTDGPWCPDAGNSNRYDADLLRIRKVRVTLRLQTGNRALRGSGSLAAGPDALFTNAGTAGSLSRAVPDQEIRFDVSPRNLNLGR
ncbi:MAG TPA: prepilin-type N-terminal cleavage/methylation domain-containing protein [Vicinamibacterales bacterium]|nr:prepilin-type N-terminal cleavage/methylation domain-containing protein [Vicinamibacterales bacterium]